MFSCDGYVSESPHKGRCLCAYVWKEGSKGYANLNLYNYRFPCEFSLERMRENGVYEEEMRRELKRKSC